MQPYADKRMMKTSLPHHRDVIIVHPQDCPWLSRAASWNRQSIRPHHHPIHDEQQTLVVTQVAAGVQQNKVDNDIVQVQQEAGQTTDCELFSTVKDELLFASPPSTSLSLPAQVQSPKCPWLSQTGSHKTRKMRPERQPLQLQQRVVETAAADDDDVAVIKSVADEEETEQTSKNSCADEMVFASKEQEQQPTQEVLHEPVVTAQASAADDDDNTTGAEATTVDEIIAQQQQPTAPRRRRRRKRQLSGSRILDPAAQQEGSVECLAIEDNDSDDDEDSDDDDEDSDDDDEDDNSYVDAEKNNDPEAAQEDSLPKEAKTVSFDTHITVREYEREIDTNMYMGLTLGWSYNETKTTTTTTTATTVKETTRNAADNNTTTCSNGQQQKEAVVINSNTASSSACEQQQTTKHGGEVAAGLKKQHNPERYITLLQYGYTRKELKQAVAESVKKQEQREKEQAKLLLMEEETMLLASGNHTQRKPRQPQRKTLWLRSKFQL